MARLARHFLKFSSPTYYHLISHLHLELPYLKPFEKEHLLGLLRRLSSVFAVEVLAYAILGNHFHLLVRWHGESDLTEAEAIERALSIYPPHVVFPRPGSYWRSKLSDLSQFMKELNQRFSQFYNRLHSRRGHVFYDRFRSIVVEEGEGVLAVSLYIDLNGVRAGLAKSVSGYRWVSYAARRAGAGEWLMSLRDVFGLEVKDYGKVLEGVGRLEREGKGKVEETENALFVQVFRYRAEGFIFGSLEFVEKVASGFPFRRRRRVEAGGLVLA